jgi:hypothetical protein
MTMMSYTVNFNGSGEVLEHHFDTDSQAVLWLTLVLESRGYDLDTLDSCGWDSDGLDDDDRVCERMLFWPDEVASFNDSGAKSICSLCVVR